MPGQMRIRVWDVEHGCCAMVQKVDHLDGVEYRGRLAMIDSGSSRDFSPSKHIRNVLGRTVLDYLFITNADQDHMSDLKGLVAEGVRVNTLFRNPSYTGEELRAIKRLGGPLSADATLYAGACEDFRDPPSEPFDDYMGGITARVFWNNYPAFTDTNNLSLVVFVKFGSFTMLFPGDLEKTGWRALLHNAAFRTELAATDVLMASHHGRENGFCEDVFEFLKPRCVVISDKPIAHATQQTVPDYRRVVPEAGVTVATTMRRRHVLTTRRDGWIEFNVDDEGSFWITTECHG